MGVSTAGQPHTFPAWLKQSLLHHKKERKAKDAAQLEFTTAPVNCRMPSMLSVFLLTKPPFLLFLHFIPSAVGAGWLQLKVC